jgi:hypothetical protein
MEQRPASYRAERSVRTHHYRAGRTAGTRSRQQAYTVRRQKILLPTSRRKKPHNGAQSLFRLWKRLFYFWGIFQNGPHRGTEAQSAIYFLFFPFFHPIFTSDSISEVCMTIGKTVEIPANRLLHLDFEVPIEVPIGKAQIELKVIPFVDKQKKSALKNTDNSLTPHTDALLNILSNLGDININEIREERLAKHL